MPEETTWEDKRCNLPHSFRVLLHGHLASMLWAWEEARHHGNGSSRLLDWGLCSSSWLPPSRFHQQGLKPVTLGRGLASRTQQWVSEPHSSWHSVLSSRASWHSFWLKLSDSVTCGLQFLWRAWASKNLLPIHRSPPRHVEKVCVHSR